MDWKDLVSTVAKSAPALGAALGGPAGAAVGGLIAAAFGVDRSAQAVAEAVANDPSAAVKLREIEDANLSEKEKADRDLKEAREQLDAIRTQKAWAEAMAEHQCLTKEDFDLIGAGSPQEVREKAAKLAARLDAQAVSKTDSDHINPLLRADPTGGTDPTSKKTDDWMRSALAR